VTDAIDREQHQIGAAEQFGQPAHIVLHAAVVMRQAAIMLFDIAPHYAAPAASIRRRKGRYAARDPWCHAASRQRSLHPCGDAADNVEMPTLLTVIAAAQAVCGGIFAGSPRDTMDLARRTVLFVGGLKQQVPHMRPLCRRA